MTRKATAPTPKPATRTKNPAPTKKTTAPTTAPVKSQAPAKERTDWEAVARDYRVGKLTLREMAEKHGITAGRICQKAKELAWTRGDLKKVVNEATQALLVAEQVEGEVNKVKQGLNDAVLGAAELNKQVILRHRNRIQRTTDVAMRMLDELDSTTTQADKLQELFTIASTDMDDAALQSFRQQFREFMKLHNRIGSVQKLTAALRDAQNLEAQAFGNIYDGKTQPGDDTANLTDEELDGAIEQVKAKLGL